MLVHQTPGVCTSKWRPYRKPMKIMQKSLGGADASLLTCDNTSERTLQTLKPINVLNRDTHEGRVRIIEVTADVRTGNVLDAV